MVSWFRRLAALSVVAALGSPLAAQPLAAEPQDLFSVVTPSDAAGAAMAPRPPASRATVRLRLARINLDALFPPAASAAGAGAKAPGVRIVLFPGTAATFTPKDVEAVYGGAQAWRGATDDGDPATLIVSDGKVAGRVILKGRTYRISPAGGRVHRIAEVDRRRLPNFGPSIEPPAASPTPAEAPGAAGVPGPDGRTVVTALFAHTERTKAASQNVLLDSLMSLELANDAFKASGVRIKLKFVGLVAVKDYDEFDRTFEQILGDLARPSPEFAETHRMRDRKGADLVLLLREEGEYCGQAMVNAPPAGMAHRAFSESRRDCIEFNVVAHEIGHNMGLYHDRFVHDEAPKKQYNFGYVDVVNGYQDIMAYADKCASKGLDCEEITYFSNPELKFHGRPFGIEKGRKGAADAARWLNEHAADVAAFRPDVPVSPADETAEARAAMAADPAR